jgi:hypothetical protein
MSVNGTKGPMGGLEGWRLTRFNHKSVTAVLLFTRTNSITLLDIERRQSRRCFKTPKKQVRLELNELAFLISVWGIPGDKCSVHD